MSDLDRFVFDDDKVQLWKERGENASARRELALIDRRIELLISQYQPLNSLGMSREILKCVFRYVRHGDESRMMRDIGEVKP